ncbi:MAG: hypothetical protein ABT940_12570, partial [Alphaproteobacteria bacterium]
DVLFLNVHQMLSYLNSGRADGSYPKSGKHDSHHRIAGAITAAVLPEPFAATSEVRAWSLIAR